MAPLPARTEVVVVGAGAAGLATAACLRRASVPCVLLERADVVAPAWRGHYDRLHLHTDRGHSGLPFLPMPRSYPRYPSRDQVVDYLEMYARELRLQPRLGVPVEQIHREDGAWLTEVPGGSIRSGGVVVATGYTGRPVKPSWPGLESFPGPVLHSSEYRNGGPFTGGDVLVVGFGNSGGEIALDLAEHDARPVVSVRGSVNVVPRDVLGVPLLTLAIPLSRLPPRLADLLSWPLLKLHYPSYRRLGLTKAVEGPFRQIAERRRIPLLDIGTIREIRRGRIRVRAGVDRIDGSTVSFQGGETGRFDAMILATGYQPAVAGFLEADGLLLDHRGTPRTSGTESAAEGLYFCGFHVAPTGMLREVGREAQRITASIVRRVGRRRKDKE